MDYRTRQKLAQMRQVVRNAAPRIAPLAPVGSPVMPDNAMQLPGRGQLTAIYDVLDADGNELYVHGVNGMDDSTYVP